MIVREFFRLLRMRDHGADATTLFQIQEFVRGERWCLDVWYLSNGVRARDAVRVTLVEFGTWYDRGVDLPDGGHRDCTISDVHTAMCAVQNYHGWQHPYRRPFLPGICD